MKKINNKTYARAVTVLLVALLVLSGCAGAATGPVHVVVDNADEIMPDSVNWTVEPDSVNWTIVQPDSVNWTIVPDSVNWTAQPESAPDAQAEIGARGIPTGAGTTNFDNVSVSGYLDVGVDLDVAGDFAVAGATDVTGDLTVANLYATSDITAGANVTVTGDVTAANLYSTADITAGANVTVTGDIAGTNIAAGGFIDAIGLIGGGSIYGDAEVSAGTWLNGAGQTPIVVADSDVITPTGTYQTISSAGEVTASLETSDMTGGNLLVLINVGSNTINLADSGTLMLTAAAALGEFDTLTLWFDGTNWIELSRADN